MLAFLVSVIVNFVSEQLYVFVLKLTKMRLVLLKLFFITQNLFFISYLKVFKFFAFITFISILVVRFKLFCRNVM